MPVPDWRLMHVRKVLEEGGIIAYPTEGVWGLGCLPENEAAVTRILTLKKRPVAKGLILVASDIGQLGVYLEGLTSEQKVKLNARWPGPTTFLVPDNGSAPPWIRGRHPTLALRVSAHPVVCALCEELGQALVSTSANPASHPPAMSLLQVRRYFGDKIDALVPGDLGDAQGPTEIIDLQTLDQLRDRTGTGASTSEAGGSK